MLERLQKIIARAGVASRRHAEQLILAGQVRVNGAVVTTLGAKADPERDSIRVGSRVIRPSEEKLYVLLHKPPGCVATMHDPEGRPSLRELLRGIRGRVFPVGRLDFHSSGALLLTSDGDFAARFLKVSEKLPKTFVVKVKGLLTPELQNRLRRATHVRVRPVRGGENAWYEVTLEGQRIDDIRSALARMEHPVEKVKRVKLTEVELASLPPGRWRYLDSEEVARLHRAVARAEAHPQGNMEPARGAAKKSVGRRRRRFRPGSENGKGTPSTGSGRTRKRTSNQRAESE